MTSPNTTLTDAAEDALAQTRNAIGSLADDARDLTRRGVDAVRDGTHELREQGRHAADATVGYIRHEPVKSVLIAAAAGAVLMALATLASRSIGHRD